MVGFFFMASLFFAPISILGSQYNQALTAMAGAERLYRLLDLQPEWGDVPDAVVLQPIRGHVQFCEVSFGYEPGTPVLQRISFEARPGQMVALVGQTGSGKSSIINLIARFYRATEGVVLVDGTDICRLQDQSLHRQLGMVQQQNFLFSGTVADNIRFGCPEADDERIRDVLRRLDCEDLLESLPEGLQTSVGEGGSSLSAGQKQLLCFARAMLADPAILILDEATSSIDSGTEARLQRALESLICGRTSFVVAHRLSTIRRADQVLVLDGGRIVERGTHSELLAAGGVYSGLHAGFAGVGGTVPRAA